jgi:hypothetical protein
LDRQSPLLSPSGIMTPKGGPFLVVGWFAILSVIGTLMHFDLIDKREYPGQRQLHRSIVAHSAPAPYQYRILQPALVDVVLRASRAQRHTRTYELLFLGSYAAIRFLAILTTLAAVFFSLRLTWTAGIALFATTALAAFIPFTYRYYYYQPTSIVEMAFFGLGLLAVCTRTPSALLPLVAIGTLNRETMCFIPFTYFLYWLPKLRRKEWVWLGVSVMAWLVVFAGLRLLWPADTNLTSISKSLSKNLTLSRGNLDLITILAPLILVLFRARQLPAPYLRLALCSLPWLLLHFFTATWYEIRYYMPVLIWLLPGLVFVFSQEATETENTKSVGEQPLGGDAVFRASQPYR